MLSAATLWSAATGYSTSSRCEISQLSLMALSSYTVMAKAMLSASCEPDAGRHAPSDMAAATTVVAAPQKSVVLFMCRGVGGYARAAAI